MVPTNLGRFPRLERMSEERVREERKFEVQAEVRRRQGTKESSVPSGLESESALAFRPVLRQVVLAMLFQKCKILWKKWLLGWLVVQQNLNYLQIQIKICIILYKDGKLLQNQMINTFQIIRVSLIFFYSLYHAIYYRLMGLTYSSVGLLFSQSSLRQSTFDTLLVFILESLS